MTSVVIVGQGYVGLPLAMRAVAVGFDVTGYDLDEGRVQALADGVSYVEDVPSAEVAAALASGRYRAVTDLKGVEPFDIAVITVPTPLREGNPDLSYIDTAGAALAPLLREGATVVLESTTYPGTTEERRQPLLEAGSGLTAGRDFHLGYSPERIDPGNPTWTLVNTPKVVSGIDAASLAAVEAFYGRIVERTVPVRSPKEAELTKLLENTFRHVNIALVNELAVYANDLGIDVWEAIDAAATKPFGFLPFRPGPGVGGHCLPVDPSYLSWAVRRTLGRSFRFVELANDVNDHMPDHVVQRLVLARNREHRSLGGARVLLLGVSFKRNVGDWRESPTHRVADLLLGLGAEVVATDPHVDPRQFPDGVAAVELTADELRRADVVVLLVDHDLFDRDLVVAESRYVFDTRACLPAADNVERL